MELITDSKDERLEFDTLCPECGPRPLLDEDGCCATCGSSAQGTGASTVMLSLRRSLRERDAALSRAEAAEAENAALKGQLCAAREQTEELIRRFGKDNVIAVTSFSGPCPHAAIAERTKDVEEIAKALYIATEELDSDMGRWAATFDDLEEKGKNMWIKVARTVVRYLNVDT